MSVKITSSYISTPNIIDIREYETLSQAISAIGSEEKTLLICEPFIVEEDVTVPENICLKFTKGGKLVVAGGYTVTINSSIDAGLYQIFDGEGLVTGNPKIKEAYPEWFGAKGDGVSNDAVAWQKTLDFWNNSSLNTLIVKFSASRYYIGTPATLSKGGLEIVGNGVNWNGREQIECPNGFLQSSIPFGDTTGAYIKYLTLRDLSFTRGAEDAPSSQACLSLSNVTDIKAYNLYFYYPNAPAIHGEDVWDSEFVSVFVNRAGEPDGVAAFHLQDGDSSSNQVKLIGCRFENCTGRMVVLSGFQNGIYSTKFHAPSNANGSVEYPAVSMSRNSVFTGNLLENFGVLGGIEGISCVLDTATTGVVVSSNVFRNNSLVPALRISGNAENTFISDNVFAVSTGIELAFDINAPILSPSQLQYVESDNHTSGYHTNYEAKFFSNVPSPELTTEYLYINKSPEGRIFFIANSNTGRYTAGEFEAYNWTDPSFVIKNGRDAGFQGTILSIDTNQDPTNSFNILTVTADANNNDSGTNILFKFVGDGNAYADGSWTGGGADYAELFESANGEELPVGATVVLERDKVRVATPEDPEENIIGVVRPKTASFILGNNPLNWKDKYLRDEYGGYIYEEVELVEWEEDGKLVVYEVSKIERNQVPQNARFYKTRRRILNPNYNPNEEYISRLERPEWNIIGLLGQIPVNKKYPIPKRWIKMRDISETVALYFVR